MTFYEQIKDLGISKLKINENSVNGVKDNISVDIYDKAWNSSAPSYHTYGEGTARNGVAVTTISSCPSAYGQYGFVRSAVGFFAKGITAS